MIEALGSQAAEDALLGTARQPRSDRIVPLPAGPCPEILAGARHGVSQGHCGDSGHDRSSVPVRSAGSDRGPRSGSPLRILILKPDDTGTLSE